MPLPPETQHLLLSHDFDSSVDEVPREPHYTRADLLSLSKSQLIAAFLDLQGRADQYLSHIESSLRAQQSQAELLTSIELHLDIPPSVTESHHQHVALDHALTWNEIYGPDSDLLLQTSTLQTQVFTRRLTSIRDHIRESGGGGASSSSNFSPSPSYSSNGLSLSPATLCKHVLSTTFTRMAPGSFVAGSDNPEEQQNVLSFKQVALGMSIREFIESFAEDEGRAEEDDNELWRRMETPLLCALATPEMSDAAWNRMGFLGAWFRALRSGHFEVERMRFLMEMQKDAREKTKTERAVPMVCTECKEEKAAGNEVATRLVKAQAMLLEWWKGGREEVESVVEGIVERFREEDRKEAKRAYEEFAKSMRGVVTTATATDDAEATEQGQAGPGHPVLMPPDDLSHAGRYEPEFQPKEINSLVRQAHMGDL
ncbi:hypothetical protein GE21DRAFT_1853 [Neurospora crassa]|uniref:Uncharacterized protein n=1 Tax=Neurospora crassa (strain ATCC 24698 / 74-OR23-1A / CBS 708.71 / DSM 1257 / FGSC 987) TaxID=367110 RepID=Q7SFH8_NEUCR|nr:hypothetical protein NCU00853 [Neurospora crassa OR74A]EAA35533.1 hypothetical protein NCU00853 [Neurospora crassa OR74A]KHE82169.1 hypothetical protein GE21DRAFT_1853 [Neurospora crassa]|eukprot:XP_964769.1 hypothetical protein NCU00853 [Neurospora crassa OR74A]